MRHDGVKISRARHLGYRMANPEVDKDLDGHPVPANYVVIVPVASCETFEKDGRSYYDPKTATKSIPINHGGTYYGYGKQRVRKNGTGQWVLDPKTRDYVFATEYVTIPYYVVNDGYVYTGTLRRTLDWKDK